jgi:hypothetical protein
LFILLQLYSGRKIDGASGLVPIDPAQLTEAWKTLRRQVSGRLLLNFFDPKARRLFACGELTRFA